MESVNSRTILEVTLHYGNRFYKAEATGGKRAGKANTSPNGGFEGTVSLRHSAFFSGGRTRAVASAQSTTYDLELMKLAS